jgi:hypothetical protein
LLALTVTVADNSPSKEKTMREVRSYISEARSEVTVGDLPDVQREGVTEWIKAVADTNTPPVENISRNQALGWELRDKLRERAGKCAGEQACRIVESATVTDAVNNTKFSLFCRALTFNSADEATSDELRCNTNQAATLQNFIEHASEAGHRYANAKCELEEAKEDL